MFVDVLHCIFWKNGPISFAIDHSPCSRMIVTLKERFDSVAVSESISSSMTNLSVCWVNGCPPTGPTALAPNIFIRCPLLRRPLVVNVPFLRSLMSQRPSQVSLFLFAAHSTSSEVRSDFQMWVFPGLSDAVEASTFGSLTLYRETQLIIGFDFAVTLSSPASSCVLFDIASRLLMELK